MRPVLPLDLRAVDQAKVGLIEQRRRLQAVSSALGGHAVPRYLVQLAVHERDELLERGGIAIRPGSEQRRNIGRSHGGRTSYAIPFPRAPASRLALLLAFDKRVGVGELLA